MARVPRVRFDRLDAVEGVGVVVEYDAAAEMPFPVLLGQVAFVMAGRELPARAIAGDQYQQVAGGVRPVAGELAPELRCSPDSPKGQ